MKKGYIVLISLIAILILVGSVYAAQQMPSTCILPNSNNTLGYGAVKVCDNMYRCSDQTDFVCPEDFKDNNGTVGNCSSCADADCTGNVYGHVTDSKGRALEKVKITAHPLTYHPGVLETSAETDVNGNYGKDPNSPETGGIPFYVTTGTYYFSAEKEGYDTELKEATVVRNQNTRVDFQLLNGTCHADCTNSYGRCNKECEGYSFGGETCHFYSGAAELCNNKKLGTSVLYHQIQGQPFSEFIDCCEGSPYLKYYVTADLGGNIDNLIQYQKILKYDGSPIKLIIASYTVKK